MKIETPESLDRATVYRLLAVTAAVGFLLFGCLLVLRPFIPGILLAAILTLATWPAFITLDKKLRHRRTLAALLMTLLLALFFLAPLFLLGSSLAESFTKLVGAAAETLQANPAEAPGWLRDLPLVGAQADLYWQDYVHNRENAVKLLQKHAGGITQFLIGTGGAIGRGIFDVSLGVFISFFMFRHGALLDERIRTLTGRFAGDRGTRLLAVSKQTLVGVVYGLLGMALAQGAVAAIGFSIAGVPGAPFLGLLTMLLSFLPVGPPLIWGPAALWLFAEGQTGMAVFMGLWGFFAISSIDNVIRPLFISMGSKLPVLIAIFGAIGGIASFGFMGLFVGPTLLAVAYTIVAELSASDAQSPARQE